MSLFLKLFIIYKIGLAKLIGQAKTNYYLKQFVLKSNIKTKFREINEFINKENS